MCNVKYQYKGYQAYIKYDPEDGLFVGHVIGIGDVLSFHAHTKDEAEERFHFRIDDYIDICKRHGKNADKST